MMKLLSSLPKGMDIFTVLETMPSKQLMDMKQEMNKVTDAMGRKPQILPMQPMCEMNTRPSVLMWMPYSIPICSSTGL